MELLKNIFKVKDKKQIFNLAIIFLVGILLLVFGSFFANQPKNTIVLDELPKEEARSVDYDDYVSMLEAKLENTLKLVDGAGSVKVMVTLSYSKEQIIATNSRTEETENTENDGQGGSRQQHSSSSQQDYVIITQRDGSQQPLVIKEIEPLVAGVIIIAEGGGDIVVKDALTRAAFTVLNIEPHKVQVLQMKPH